MLPPPPPPDEPVNPFDAPKAAIGARTDDFVSDTEAEAIRRAHIGHEASVQAVGMLYYLGAFFMGLATLGILISTVFAPTGAFNVGGPGGLPPRAFVIVIAVFYAAITALNGALGYGLRSLQVWARWTVAVLTGLALLYFLLVGAVLTLLVEPVAGLIFLAIGGGLSGYILYLLVSPKGTMVFSRPYQAGLPPPPYG